MGFNHITSNCFLLQERHISTLDFKNAPNASGTGGKKADQLFRIFEVSARRCPPAANVQNKIK
jgi:hypothetical protein